MQRIILGFVLMFTLSIGTYAQDAGYKAEAEGWLVDLDEAYNISKKTGKPIMANFTGSDWCGWCVRLKKSVFSKPEFKKWAEKNVVLIELDFPRRKKLPSNIQYQNNNLRQAFGVRGYPTVWVFNLDKKGENKTYNIDPIGKTGYKASPEEFIGEIEAYMKEYKKKK